MSAETIIREVTERKIENETVRVLFSGYCDTGVLNEVGNIVDQIPSELRDPIIHTLGSHITKEKPMMVYSALRSKEISDNKAIPISATVDILWALSLMYDDMFDQDKKRAGETSAWVEFGSDTTFKSAQAGLEAVKNRLNLALGDEAAQTVDKYIGKSLISLKEHKQIKLGSGAEYLLTNYSHRSLFHTGLPFALVDMPTFSSDTSFIALDNVNIAGQILNDLKDVSPKYAWVRESFSDIRTGVTTVPIEMMFGSLPDHDREKFKSLFGKANLEDDEKETIISMFSQAKAIDKTVTLAEELYRLSQSGFEKSIHTQYLNYVSRWLNYKRTQLKELI